MSKSEHISALFIGGLFYWIVGEEATAAMCWKTAVDILGMNVIMVGDA
jgi:hypothetical protein